MLVVNFFGGPGAGKSTAAAGLFYEMKRHWIDSEYVQEFAKELVWANNGHMLSEQNYIFAEQEHRLNRLRQKVAVSISDSPLLLSSFYAPPGYPDSFHESVFEFFHTYRNINILVRRSHEYSAMGRIQGQSDADNLSARLEKYMSDNGIPYVSITASDASPRRLLTWLIENGHCPPPPAALRWIPDPPTADWFQIHGAQPVWNSGRAIIRADLAGIRTVGPSEPDTAAG